MILFRRAVIAADFESAFALVHPIAAGAVPGSDDQEPLFAGFDDPTFVAYALDVAGPFYHTCTYIPFGESFGLEVGAVELRSDVGSRAVTVRVDEEEWRIDERSDHVTTDRAESDVGFTTPLATFDTRLLIDGSDVAEFDLTAAASDPNTLRVSLDDSGLLPGPHYATFISMLDNGLVDAASVRWMVP